MRDYEHRRLRRIPTILPTIASNIYSRKCFCIRNLELGLDDCMFEYLFNENADIAILIIPSPEKTLEVYNSIYVALK